MIIFPTSKNLMYMRLFAIVLFNVRGYIYKTDIY